MNYRWNTVLVLAALLASCGDDEAAPTGRGAVTSEVKVIATEFAFETDVSSIPAGKVKTVLINDGKQPHQVGFYRLNEGVAFDYFKRTVMRDETQIPRLARGGVVGVMRTVGSGETGSTIGGPLESGTYALMCFIRDEKTAKTHAELGMIAPFAVR